MPRATRRRRCLDAQKSQLLFVEEPRNGSRHDYGPQLRSAVNPRCFVSEQSRESGVSTHSWVSHEFTSLNETAVRFGGQNKKNKKNQLPKSSLNRPSLTTQVRRSTVCRYPALLFDTSNTIPLRCSRVQSNTVSHETRCTEETDVHDNAPVSLNISRESNANTPGVGVTHTHVGSAARKLPAPTSITARTCTLETSSAHTPPPHIQTPEMQRIENSSASSLLNLLFFPNQPKTPPRTAAPLVSDTPERDYGIKVTWRRRKKLMRLLEERGQLLNTEVMISNQWPEVV